MLTEREVLSTINMLRSEHLDVRTVTLGINLFDCASHDFDVFELKVRSKILKYAKRLVETCNGVGDRYGIPVVNKRIAVSAIGTVCAGFSTDQMVRVCRILDECTHRIMEPSIYKAPGPFVLETGHTLPELRIAYHTYGKPNAAYDNVVWVCHALTANSDVAGI